MLNAIKKVFNTNNKEVEMVKENVSPEMAVTGNVTELAAQLASQSTVLADLQASFAELTTQLAEAQASLAAVESAKQELLASAAAAKLAARSASLVAAVGTDKAPALLANLSVLDDAAFESVVSSMNTNLSVEAESPMFKEVGVTAVVDATKVTEESSLTRKLKQKYSAKAK